MSAATRKHHLRGQAVAEYGLILIIVSLSAVAALTAIVQSPIKTMGTVNSGFSPRNR